MPHGELFSRLYLQRGEALTDSERFRTRLAAHFSHYVTRDGIRGEIAKAIRMQLGVEVPNYGAGPLCGEFFRRANIRDVLDTITIVFFAFVAEDEHRKARAWVEDVASIFSEEGLLYSIDDEGGVHRAVDSEFDRNRAASIRALGSPRFRAVADALERAYAKLAQHDQDNKGAVRDCFEAAETLAKVVCDRAVSQDRCIEKPPRQRIRGYLRKLKHQQQHQLCDAGTSRFKQLRRSLAMCPVAGLCLS